MRFVVLWLLHAVLLTVLLDDDATRVITTVFIAALLAWLR